MLWSKYFGKYFSEDQKAQASKNVKKFLVGKARILRAQFRQPENQDVKNHFCRSVY